MLRSAHTGYCEADAVPATWQERGVVMPFTTPALAFARLRQGADGQLEVVLRRPDGLKGVYAIRLNALSSFAAPSLFDRTWLSALATKRSLDPALIAKARNEGLRTGRAGRAAMEALRAGEEANRARVNTTLAAIMGIIANAAGPAIPQPEATATGIMAFAATHRDRFAQMASRIGATPETLTAALHHFADALLLMSQLQRDMTNVRALRDALDEVRLFDETEFLALRCAQNASAMALRVAEDGIARFRQQLTNPLPCLARILKDLGSWRAPLELAAQAMDGWRLLVGFWAAVQETVPEHDLRAVWCIGRSAPPLPADVNTLMGEDLATVTAPERWPTPSPRIRALGTTPRQEELEWAITKAA